MNDEDTIIKLWEEGWTATEIGERLSRTRSSILGQIKRMRAKGVYMAPRTAPSKEKKKGSGSGKLRKALRAKIQNQLCLKFDDFVKPPEVIKPLPQIDNITIAKKELSLLIDLSIDDCRYIVGRNSSGALYCAQPSHRRSMCKEHYKLCYVRLKA